MSLVQMAECAPLAALPGMAALSYQFSRLAFKGARPHRENLADKTASVGVHP